MPRGDGTGPMGTGPMMGRGAGYCSGFSAPGYANPVGRAGGFGCGRGFRRMMNFNTGYVSDAEVIKNEKEGLSRQAEYLEKQLKQVKMRLSDLKKDDE